MWKRAFPFLAWTGLVNGATLRADLQAGLVGAVIVLPQGVAFAVIAGLPPQYGLYTAIVVPVIAALFGSSLHMVSGPTMAISIVVFSVVSAHAAPGSVQFVELALALTLMVGLIQLAFGLARLGTLINFISPSVLIAFTAGAAVLILTSQAGPALGLEPGRGGSVFNAWRDIWQQRAGVDPRAVAIAATTVLASVLVRRRWPASPHLLAGLAAGTLAHLVLGFVSPGIATIGALPASLPPLSTPPLNLDTLRVLGPGALAVALIGLIEAVAIARAIALGSQQRIDANQEFTGQGLSNAVGSFFSCYAASGSFTRSALNYSAGASTPLSAVFSAVILAVIVLALAPLAAAVPVPAVAGVILLVALHLVDVPRMLRIARTSRQEAAVLGTTFAATLLLELEFAIYAGVLLSLVFYLMQTGQPRVYSMAPDPDDPQHHFLTSAEKRLPECRQLKVLRIDGSLYFGAIDHVERALQLMRETADSQRRLLVVASGINFIDVAGCDLLEREAARRRAMGGDLYLCDVKPAVMALLRRGGYLQRIGKGNVFATKAHALARIFASMEPEQCAPCDRRVFRECESLESRIAAAQNGH